MGQNQSADEEPEGSARERFKENPGRRDYHDAHLLDNTCPLLQQPLTVLDLILSFLPASDLSSLAQSCKVMNQIVEEFLLHSLHSHKLVSNMRLFLSANSGLLTQQEMLMSQNLSLQCESQRSPSKEDLLHLMECLEQYEGRVRRISCCDQRVEFLHRDNPELVTIVHDDLIARNITVVSDLRQFECLELHYTWEEVPPGVYTVSVRMRFGENRGPQSETYRTEWKVKWPGVEDTKEQVCIGSAGWWQKLSSMDITEQDISKGQRVGHVAGWVAGSIAGRMVGGVGGQLAGQIAGRAAGRAMGGKAVEMAAKVRGKWAKWDMDGLRIEWESDGEDFTGWFWVRLEAFEVKRDGEVKFTVKDVEPLGWSSDLVLDILELKRD